MGDIKAAKECGATGVIVEIPSSDHIIKNAYGWTVDRAMKSSIDATLAAKELGLYTVFFTIDSTRTEVDRLLDIAERVATEGPHGRLHDRRQLRRRRPGGRLPRRQEGR